MINMILMVCLQKTFLQSTREGSEQGWRKRVSRARFQCRAVTGIANKGSMASRVQKMQIQTHQSLESSVVQIQRITSSSSCLASSQFLVYNRLHYGANDGKFSYH
ncbi:hypothetical protein HS088_TW10G00279 [Tripterygium wilfordii]|uniref:Uncharacterized protein n=1 Tax=Tripterygium wilfordii TaxID=458696 RepID=A0A7J7D4N6_TRIWF|nr:hypothetical protein HS088_TW10G00279 [Tripterygium wilfordii]